MQLRQKKYRAAHAEILHLRSILRDEVAPLRARTTAALDEIRLLDEVLRLRSRELTTGFSSRGATGIMLGMREHSGDVTSFFGATDLAEGLLVSERPTTWQNGKGIALKPWRAADLAVQYVERGMAELTRRDFGRYRHPLEGTGWLDAEVLDPSLRRPQIEADFVNKFAAAYNTFNADRIPVTLGLRATPTQRLNAALAFPRAGVAFFEAVRDAAQDLDLAARRQLLQRDNPLTDGQPMVERLMREFHNPDESPGLERPFE